MHNWNKGSNNIVIPTKTTNSTNLLLSQLTVSYSQVASMKLASFLEHEHGVLSGHEWLYSQHWCWLHSQIAPHFDISHTEPIVVKTNPAAIMPPQANVALDTFESASFIFYCDSKGSSELWLQSLLRLFTLSRTNSKRVSNGGKRCLYETKGQNCYVRM